MIDAAEASKLTYQAIQTNVAEKMVKIEEKIKDAIKNGTFSFTHEGTLSSDVINELRKLGYKAENQSHYNECYYTISWKESKYHPIKCSQVTPEGGYPKCIFFMNGEYCTAREGEGCNVNRSK